MPLTFDAIVVGAGYIGCSIAYSLSCSGLRTALVEQGEVAGGASRANYGNVQVQDAELDHSLPLVTTGLKRFTTLEDELGCSVGYRKLGSLLIIENEAQWDILSRRIPHLHQAGIRAEIVPASLLRELEPLLDPKSILGACYHETEGQVYPFALMWAYIRQALAQGLALFTNTEMAQIELLGGHIAGIHTNKGFMSSPCVILATGAWTPSISAQLGRQWAIQHVRGQALVTERSDLRLRNHIASAAFFEATQDDQPGTGEGQTESQSGPAVLAISQSAHGNFLLGEAAIATTTLDRGTIPSGIEAIATTTLKYLPILRHTRGLRTWAAPVAFTSDGMPYLGSVSDIPGLIIATAFKSTVIITPLVGQIVTQIVHGQQTEIDIAPFTPDRVVARF